MVIDMQEFNRKGEEQLERDFNFNVQTVFKTMSAQRFR